MEYFIEDCIENRWISIPLMTAFIYGASYLVIFVLLGMPHTYIGYIIVFIMSLLGAFFVRESLLGE